MSPKLFRTPVMSKTESTHSHSRAAGAEKVQGPAKLLTAPQRSQRKETGSTEREQRKKSAVLGY